MKDLSLELGDIILVKGSGLFSKAIMLFGKLQTGEARVSHAALYIGDGLVIESIAWPEWKIRINEVENYKVKDTVVYRISGHGKQMETVVHEAKKFAGNQYAWWKIPLFALDGVSSFVSRNPVYFFTGSAKITNWQVCSQFIAYCFYKFSSHKWLLDWRKMSPDLMDDDLKRGNLKPCHCEAWEVKK